MFCVAGNYFRYKYIFVHVLVSFQIVKDDKKLLECKEKTNCGKK